MQSTGTLSEHSQDVRTLSHIGHPLNVRAFASKGRTRALVLLTSLCVLAACEEGGVSNFFATPPKSPSADAATTPQTSTKIVERDIEAPDVFQVSADGLWDGRPSLGGVWVAHEDVTDPERVIIRNTANGKFVIGALFKRERSAPGPDIQVSSDAAEALGMLAGSPTDLNVTALRREDVPQATPAEAAPIEAETIEAAEAIETATLDPIANAAATLDALETPSAPVVSAPKPKPTPAASSLSKPYIQIGIFSVKSNADRTVSMLGSQGLNASVKQGTSSGKAFWRVLVGPAGTSGERSGLLEKVKASGFTDAYFVTH